MPSYSHDCHTRWDKTSGCRRNWDVVGSFILYVKKVMEQRERPLDLWVFAGVFGGPALGTNAQPVL